MDGLYEQFRIALHQVWRRRWLALGVAWGVCLLGWLVLALIPNSYESKAKVFAQMQTILPEKIGITQVDRQNDLLRIKQMLTSTENLQKVVRATDLNQLVASDRDLAAQVTALRENIKITAQLDNASVIEISASSGIGSFSNGQNARTASAVVQNLLDLFNEENLAGNRTEIGQSLAFLDEELKRREAQLQQAEQRRAEFDAQYMGLLPGDGTIEQRMSSARVELANIERELMTAQSSLTALRSQMAGIPAAIATPGVGGGFASNQIAALESQLSTAQARGWTDRHPDVVATRAEIARLRPQAAAERRNGGGVAGGTPNPAYVSLRAMAAEKEAQVAAATARKNQIQQAMAQLAAATNEPGLVSEQAQLSRDYEVMKREYDKLLQDREQVRLRGDVASKTDAINFRVIEPPSRPQVPAAPNRPIFLSVILILALGAGAGAAFVAGQLQMTFPTQARLAQVTGLPVLGSVSEIFTAEKRALQRQRLKWFAGAGGALAGGYALLMLVEFWQRSTVA